MENLFETMFGDELRKKIAAVEREMQVIAALAGLGNKSSISVKSTLFLAEGCDDAEFVAERHKMAEEFLAKVSEMAKKRFGPENVMTVEELLAMGKIARNALYAERGIQPPVDDNKGDDDGTSDGDDNDN